MSLPGMAENLFSTFMVEHLLQGLYGAAEATVHVLVGRTGIYRCFVPRHVSHQCYSITSRSVLRSTGDTSTSG